jgi:hypothetical protein
LQALPVIARDGDVSLRLELHVGEHRLPDESWICHSGFHDGIAAAVRPKKFTSAIVGTFQLAVFTANFFDQIESGRST